MASISIQNPADLTDRAADYAVLDCIRDPGAERPVNRVELAQSAFGIR